MLFALSLSIVGCGDKDTDDSAAVDDSASADDSDVEIVDPDAWAWEMDPSTLPAGASPCAEPVLVRVQRVIDGDTADVQEPTGGELLRLRMVGIDTPELGYEDNPPECYGEEARDSLRDLIQGRLVWLTFDRNCTDHFDRTLAYVHKGTGEGAFVNRALLRAGNGPAFPWEGTSTFDAEFQAAEDEARENGRGLWGACP